MLFVPVRLRVGLECSTSSQFYLQRTGTKCTTAASGSFLSLTTPESKEGDIELLVCFAQPTSQPWTSTASHVRLWNIVYWWPMQSICAALSCSATHIPPDIKALYTREHMLDGFRLLYRLHKHSLRRWMSCLPLLWWLHHLHAVAVAHNEAVQGRHRFFPQTLLSRVLTVISNRLLRDPSSSLVSKTFLHSQFFLAMWSLNSSMLAVGKHSSDCTAVSNSKCVNVCGTKLLDWRVSQYFVAAITHSTIAGAWCIKSMMPKSMWKLCCVPL